MYKYVETYAYLYSEKWHTSSLLCAQDRTPNTKQIGNNDTSSTVNGEYQRCSSHLQLPLAVHYYNIVIDKISIVMPQGDLILLMALCVRP